MPTTIHTHNNTQSNVPPIRAARQHEQYDDSECCRTAGGAAVGAQVRNFDSKSYLRGRNKVRDLYNMQFTFDNIPFGPLSGDTTESELCRVFSAYGHVKSTKIIVDRAGVSKGYGFVTFETEQEAQRLQNEVSPPPTSLLLLVRTYSPPPTQSIRHIPEPSRKL